MCIANIWYKHHLLRLKESDCSCKGYEPRSIGLRRSRPLFRGDHLTRPIPQGADADDFNPDRFIDADGNLILALPDTKDGASMI